MESKQTICLLHFLLRCGFCCFCCCTELLFLRCVVAFYVFISVLWVLMHFSCIVVFVAAFLFYGFMFLLLLSGLCCCIFVVLLWLLCFIFPRCGFLKMFLWLHCGFCCVFDYALWLLLLPFCWGFWFLLLHCGFCISLTLLGQFKMLPSQQ